MSLLQIWWKKSTSGETPALTCNRCSNRFLRPGLSDEEMAIANKVFVCSVCEAGGPKAGFMKLKSGIRLGDLILENPVLMNMFGFRRSLARLLFPSKAGYVSLHKLVTCHREKILSPPKSGKWKNVETLLHKKEKLRDVQDLQERLSKVLSRKMVGTCSLCFDDVPISKLRDACGHCSHRCCEECLKSWYIQNSPGQLFWRRELDVRSVDPFRYTT